MKKILDSARIGCLFKIKYAVLTFPEEMAVAQVEQVDLFVVHVWIARFIAVPVLFPKCLSPIE